MTRLQRLFRIAWVFCRYRLDTFLPLSELPTPLKIFFLLAPWHLFPQPKMSRGDRLRLALEELGPVFVKFGQLHCIGYFFKETCVNCCCLGKSSNQCGFTKPSGNYCKI